MVLGGVWVGMNSSVVTFLKLVTIYDYSTPGDRVDALIGGDLRVTAIRSGLVTRGLLGRRRGLPHAVNGSNGLVASGTG